MSRPLSRRGGRSFCIVREVQARKYAGFDQIWPVWRVYARERVNAHPEGKTRERGLFERNRGICVSVVQRKQEISFNLALRARERPLRLSGGRQLVPDIRGALLVKFGGNPGVYRAVIALNMVRSKISSALAFRSSAIFRASSSVIQAKSSFFTLKMTTLLMIGTPWSSHP